MSSFLERVKFYKKNFLTIWSAVFAIYPIVLLVFFSNGKAQQYIDVIGIHIFIYLILAWGLTILVGTAGLLSLNYVIAYAIGAYSYTLLGIWYNISPLLLLPISALIAGLSGVVLGIPSLFFRGDIFALITLVMTEAFQVLLIQQKSLTNGIMGISIPDRLMFLGVRLEGLIAYFRLSASLVYFKMFLYYVLLGLCFLSAWIIYKFRASYTSTVLRHIRDNQKAFFKLDMNIVLAKLSAFVVSSMFAGACGALLVTTQGFVSPVIFKSSETFIILSIVIIGGMTSLSKIAGTTILLIASIELLCGSNLLGRSLQFGCSFDARHSILMMVSLFLVIFIRSYSLSKLRNPSPFLETKK